MFNYNPSVPVLPPLEGVAAVLEERERSTGLGGNIKSQEGVAAPPAEDRRASAHEKVEQKLVFSKTAKRMTLPTGMEV